MFLMREMTPRSRAIFLNEMIAGRDCPGIEQEYRRAIAIPWTVVQDIWGSFSPWTADRSFHPATDRIFDSSEIVEFAVLYGWVPPAGTVFEHKNLMFQMISVEPTPERQQRVLAGVLKGEDATHGGMVMFAIVRRPAIRQSVHGRQRTA